MERCIQLEPAAAEVSNNAAKPPLIFTLPPQEGRKVLEEAQDMPVFMYPARITCTMIDTNPYGRIKLYLIEPDYPRESRSDIIFYIHGAGWVFGSFHTHEKLVRELAARTGCTVVFPEYDRSPEVRYPVAIEQCYAALCMLPQILFCEGIRMNPDTLTVAGDSVGGNMAAAMALMSKYRGGPRIQKQLLYYPVTNACFDTCSYRLFAENYYLYRDGMIWFWNQYAPCPSDRRYITASPLCATTDQLKNLPEAMILNGEADVLRDEGEAYAKKLLAAGVPVTAIRFQSIIHDFVMLNSLDQTRACRAAMDVSTDWIKRLNQV